VTTADHKAETLSTHTTLSDYEHRLEESNAVSFLPVKKYWP